MAWVARALRVRPGEGRTVSLIVAMMIVASAGFAIGQSGIDALFFARYGADRLPIMYLIQGPLMFAASLAATGVLARIDRGAAFRAAPLVLAAALVLERLAAASGASVVLPVLWLTVSVALLIQSLFTWGVAGLVTDTRQAKRLFPLFGAGSILGWVLGGLVTEPLASAVGAPNLLLVWAAVLAATFVLVSALAPARRRRRAGRRRSRGRRTGTLRELATGLTSVRGSALMTWLAIAAVLFSVLYYSLYLPFSAAAAARYPSEDALAGFFGLFSAATTGAALLVSIFVANRLLSRIGVASVVLVLATVYVVGFALLVTTGGFAAVVTFRFIQMLFTQGVVSPAWEALVNVAPPTRRDQIRAFLNGGPTQVGTMIAGVLQLVGREVLSPRQVSAIGLGVAVLLVVAAWRVRRSYTSAVVAALREGRPQVFAPDGDTPLGGLVRDAVALQSTIDAAGDPDPRTRFVAVSVLAEVEAAEAEAALIAAVDDDEPNVRAQALRSLSRFPRSGRIAQAALGATSDPDPDVRCAAIAASSGHADGSDRARALLADPEPVVRVEAARSLLAVGADPEALAVILSEIRGRDPVSSAIALRAVAAEEGGARERGSLPGLQDAVADALRDPSPAVRAAAVEAFAATAGDDAQSVVGALGDEDALVRFAAASVLARGETGRILRALNDPRTGAGALAALELVPAVPVDEVRRFALRERDAAIADREVAEAVIVRGDGARALLRDSLGHRARGRAAASLRAVGLLARPVDATAIRAALDSLGAREGAQVANALEAIESAADPAVARPLLRLWEPIEERAGAGDEAIERSLHHVDPLIRACAEQVRANEGGSPMTETHATLGPMERVLFFRRVPLFADLAPGDLKHVADVAEERSFVDGDAIAVEGDPGEEMHVVVSGVVRVLRGSGAEEIEVARRTVGDVVGEMAIITNEPRIASLVAEGNVRTLRIDQKAFSSILRERPDTALAVMRVLSHRLAERSGTDRVL